MVFIYTSGTTGKPKGVPLSHANITANLTTIHQLLQLTPEDRSLSFLPWAHAFGHTCELHWLLSTGSSIAICDSLDRLAKNLGEVQPTLLLGVPRIFNRLSRAPPARGLDPALNHVAVDGGIHAQGRSTVWLGGQVEDREGTRELGLD